MKVSKPTYDELENRIENLELENSKLKQRIKHTHANGMNMDVEEDIYSFFNSLKDFFWILDKNGQIKFVNEYVVSRLKYTHAELYKMNVINIHPPERKEEAMKIVGQMLSGVAEFCPIPVVTKTGEYIPVETRVAKGIWNNENVIFGISKDISKLRISEEKFSKAFHLSTSMTAISDYDTGIFIDVNKVFLETLGFTKDEVIGKSSIELKLFNEETRLKTQELIDKGNECRNVEISIQNKGKTIFGLFSGSIFYLQHTKCWITTISDISNFKNAEKALKVSEERWKFALEGARDGVWDWDLVTNEVYFSPQWKAMLGFEDHEILGSVEEWSKRVHPDDLQNCYQDIQLHIDGEVPFYSNTHRVLCKNGSYKWILDRGKITTTDENGKAIKMVGTHTDLTERIEMEHELKKLNSDKDRFLQILAHDLRSPFNSLMGFSELLMNNLREYDIDEIESFLKIMNQTQQRTFDLLNDLLTWSRSQSGLLSFELEEIPFAMICDDVLPVFKSNSKNISINWSETEKIVVYADRKMVYTILRNLISNAVKFTNSNGLINVCAKTEGDFTIITVSDNGVGIKDENLHELWDFTKPYTTKGTNNETGTGFGLVLCKELVEKQSGKIWVESEFGKGSSFIFTIPVKDLFDNDK